VADGTRRRITLGALVVRGALHVVAEAAWYEQRVRLVGEDGPGGPPTLAAARLRHGGWHVRASRLWGGARDADLDVRPTGRAGAFELGVRAADARYDAAAAPFLLASADATGQRGIGAAVGWVPRRQTRVLLNVDYTRVRGPGARAERAVTARVQQGF
jgi:hypothetical protein